MAPRAVVTRNDVLWMAALLLLFVLAAAAVNVPLATTFLIHRTRPLGTSYQLQGAEAAARGWPAATPHATPWPAPDNWGKGSRFGAAYYQASSGQSNQNRNAFQMQVEEYGWPLPTLERAECWWDWNDPALKGPEPDPPLHIRWSGLVLNPLIVGGGLYLLLVAPVAAFILGRRAARRHAGRCVHCAYPLGPYDFCPECGRPVPRIATS